MSYRLIEKQVVYDGKKVRLELHQLENEQGKRHQREVCAHPGAVIILPFADEQTILLIRNRRYAVGEVLIELPAGTLEKHEDPKICASRELLEETGHMAGRIRPLRHFFTSPGILSEKMYAFAAYDLTKESSALEEGEEIEVLPTKFTEAIEMIKDGRIVDGKTIATLLMYKMFEVE